MNTVTQTDLSTHDAAINAMTARARACLKPMARADHDSRNAALMATAARLRANSDAILPQMKRISPPPKCVKKAQR